MSTLQKQNHRLFSDERKYPIPPALFSVNSLLRLNVVYPEPLSTYFGKKNAAKEMCEIMAVYSAIQAYLWDETTVTQPGGLIVSIGDGVSPRAGIVMAGRFQNWQVASIDPAMLLRFASGAQRTGLGKKSYSAVLPTNLACFAEKDSDHDWQKSAAGQSLVIILSIHSHGNLGWLLDHLQTRVSPPPQRIVSISIPCCVPQNFGKRVPCRTWIDPALESFQLPHPTRESTKTMKRQARKEDIHISSERMRPDQVFLYDSRRDIVGILYHVLPPSLSCIVYDVVSSLTGSLYPPRAQEGSLF